MPLIHDTAHAFLPYPDVHVPHASTGPLSGLCFGVKDLFDVAGYPTGGGQPFVLAMSGIKTRTAPTVQKLLDAGARFIGKTVTDELAFSMNGNNAHFGAPINGAAPDRISGGSSSGSASAVSNKLCDFTLGSDTVGSVRAPANHCGLYGIRPTHGRISLAGVLDLSPSLDTCGYFARDVETFARVSSVLLGADTAPLPQKVRLLKPLDIWAMLDADVTAAQAGPLARVAGPGWASVLPVHADSRVAAGQAAPSLQPARNRGECRFSVITGIRVDLAQVFLIEDALLRLASRSLRSARSVPGAGRYESYRRERAGRKRAGARVDGAPPARWRLATGDLVLLAGYVASCRSHGPTCSPLPRARGGVCGADGAR